MSKTKTVGIILIMVSLLLAALLVLIKANSDKQAAFLCEKFHENQIPMGQCPAHTNDNSWLITLAFGAAFLILGAGAFMMISDKGGQPKGKGAAAELQLPTEVMEKLDSEEKAVYDALKGGSGSAYQSDLIKTTGYSKVKMTRVLDKMESKGIIERKRRGMTNIVVVK